MIEIFGHFLHMLNSGPQDPFLVELRDWSTHLAQHAFVKWHGVMTSGIACTCEQGCMRPAIGGCVLCGRPTCLAHALVSGSADVACFVCIRQVVAQRAGRGAGSHVQAAPPSQEEIRKKHLKTLGLKQGATMDDIKHALRTMSLKHHPDRATPGRRPAAERKMKEISVAYHWLISNVSSSEEAA